MNIIKEFFKKIVVAILTWEARLVLLRHDPGVVAVTGNVGKTSAKDAIARTLATLSSVRKSDKSYNSEIGLPLTILGLKTAWDHPLGWIVNILRGAWMVVWFGTYPEWIVVEIGADKPGDIERVARWLKTDMVVMTPIGDIPVHVQFFDSPEALAEEKAHLLKTLRPGGVAILNADDKRVMAMNTPRHARIMTIGASPDADVAMRETHILYDEAGKPHGIACKIFYNGNLVPATLEGVLGFQHFYALLAGCAANIVRGGNVVKTLEALSGHDTPRGRLRIIPGQNHSTLLDDTYNASPRAMSAALETLREVETPGRKIAILGDMKELGSYSREAHEQIGMLAGKICTELVVVGEAAQDIGSRAEDEGIKILYRFKDSRAAADALKDYLKEEDVVLVKGSQSMRMERIVEILMARPEDKEELLVRQEEEWLKR